MGLFRLLQNCVIPKISLVSSRPKHDFPKITKFPSHFPAARHYQKMLLKQDSIESGLQAD
jgi:hypothetical protein